MGKLFWSFRIVFVVSGFHFGRFACFGGFSGFGGFVSLVSVVSVVSGVSFRSFRFVVSSFSTCPIQRAHKDCKNKRVVNRAIILYTQNPHYLCYFSLLLNAVY